MTPALREFIWFLAERAAARESGTLSADQGSMP